MAIFDSHKYLEREYPAIYKHLVKYKDKLERRGQCRYLSSGKIHNPSDKDYPGYPGMHHWLELDNNPRQKNMDDFSQQRFIWTAVNSEYRFLALNEEVYYNNSIFHGLSNKSKGIVSIMNSKIMRHYLILLSSDNYQYGGKEMMQNIPIPSKNKKCNIFGERHTKFLPPV